MLHAVVTGTSYPPCPLGVKEQYEVDRLVVLPLKSKYFSWRHRDWNPVVEIPCLGHLWVDDLTETQ